MRSCPLLLAAVAACSSHDPAPTPDAVVNAAIAKARPGDAFDRGLIGSAAARLFAHDDPGLVEVIKPPSDCAWLHRWHQGDAVKVYAHASCRVGKPFQAVFQRHFVAVPREQPAWLLVSFGPKQPGPVPLTAAGWTGCWLMVNPDPRTLMAFTPSQDGPIRSRHGCLLLDFTPHDGMAGWEFWAQQVWVQPGANAAGALASPLLHVRVGTR